jgi:hypothetical protein
MNYNSYKTRYAETKRAHKSSPEAVHMCIMNPTLMRRLSVLNEQLVETKKGKKVYLLEDKNENPYYEEMMSAKITQKLVADATDFIKYCAEEEQKEILAREKARKEVLDWF